MYASVQTGLIAVALDSPMMEIERCFDRAERCRARAAQTRSPFLRDHLFALARIYEQEAKLVASSDWVIFESEQLILSARSLLRRHRLG